MKDSWIIQVEQLKEWKKMIKNGKGENVVAQIDDIFHKLEVKEIDKEKEFNEVKLTFIEKVEDGKLYSVDAWKTDNQDEEGMSLAKIWIYNDGRFFIKFTDEYILDTPTLVYRELEKLLKDILLGKEILIRDTDDEDLFKWLEKNKDTPLIVESIEVESWGLWVKNCPYRIDLSNDYYYLA